MNKKRISLMLAGVMVVSAMALAGCGKSATESGANASGTQTEQSAEQKQEGKKSYVIEKTSEKGDTTKVVLTYENGKVIDASIDVITKDGSKTELSKEGKYVMKEGEEKHWHEQVAALVDFLKENNFDITKVTVSEKNTTDAVTGVTIKVNEYVEAIDELMKQVEAGTAKEYNTKVYSLEKTSEKGDTTVVELTYEDGKAVDASIDVKTKDGLKSELSKEGKYVMKEGEEKHWHEQAAALVDFLKENNFDTTKVTIDSEKKTTDAVTGVTIKVNEYVELIDELMKQVEAGTATEVK